MGRACLRIVVSALIPVLLVACSAKTSFNSIPTGATLDVKTSSQTAVPRTDSYRVTTFGNYEFQAQAPGKEPMYGILPLKFNGGYMALDMLFLAPLAFTNLRGVYPYYELDLDQRVIKFKRNETDEWKVYTPTTAEADRAKAFFKK